MDGGPRGARVDLPIDEPARHWWDGAMSDLPTTATLYEPGSLFAQPGYAGYLPPPHAFAPPSHRELNAYGLVAFVVALTSLTLFGLASPIAVLLGHISLHQHRVDPGRYHSRGLTIAALMIAWVQLLAWIAVIALVILASNPPS